MIFYFFLIYFIFMFLFNFLGKRKSTDSTLTNRISAKRLQLVINIMDTTFNRYFQQNHIPLLHLQRQIEA